MIEERFTEEERQRLKRIVLDWIAMESYTELDMRIFSLISGVDTVLVAHRAYPARSSTPAAQSPESTK